MNMFLQLAAALCVTVAVSQAIEPAAGFAFAFAFAVAASMLLSGRLPWPGLPGRLREHQAEALAEFVFSDDAAPASD